MNMKKEQEIPHRMIYAYDPNTNDFKIFQNPDDWKAQMTTEGAKNYLAKHLMESVKNEFTPAKKAYIEDTTKTKVGKGFFGSLRILFPTITFLGTLYKGKDKSKNAIYFMEKYMGDVNPKYKHVSDLIYKVYRHGLMHTQMPKVSEIKGKIVGWKITYNDNEHLNISESNDMVTIPISLNSFYQDLIKAVKKYINDFDDPKKNSELLKNFREGFLEMAEVVNESKLRKKCPKGVRYIRNLRR